MEDLVDEHREDGPEANPAGSQLWATTDLMLQQLRAYADLATGASVRALSGAAGPGTDMARGMLNSLQELAQQAPAPAAQLDVFLSELRAKRALIGAMQLQLTAFEQQLEQLEKTLLPIQEWGQQWTAIRSSLLNVVPPPVS
jgi:hypothetical protein